MQGMGMKRIITGQDVIITRYSENQYQNGAYKLYIDVGTHFYIYCSYSLLELQQCLERGEEMYIETHRKAVDWTIEVTLKGGIPRRPKGQKYNGDGLTTGLMKRLKEMEEINPRAIPAPGHPDPQEKAAELLEKYAKELDRFTGARELHTNTLVKRLLEISLTELIAATESRDPATAVYYEAVQRCISTQSIK